MKQSKWLFIGLALVSIGVGIMTTVFLSGYDITRPNLGSGTLPVQSASYPVVILGDSLAQGVGATTSTNSAAYLIYSYIKASHPKATLYNFGESGADVPQVLANEIPRLNTLHPKQILLIVGTNDIIKQNSPNNFTQAWPELIKTLVAFNCPTIVTNIPQFSATPAIPANLKEAAETQTKDYNAFISTNLVSYPAIRAFDFYSVSSQQLNNHDNLLSDDKFHPNDAGYALLAQELIKSL